MKPGAFLKLTSLLSLLAIGCIGMVGAQSQEPSRLARLTDAAGCVSPDIPNVPEADSATMEQMIAAQGAIQAYMAESNQLLECLDEISGDEDLPDEDRQLAIESYNNVVDDQETLAEAWNVQRTRFMENQ